MGNERRRVRVRCVQQQAQVSYLVGLSAASLEEKQLRSSLALSRSTLPRRMAVKSDCGNVRPLTAQTERSSTLTGIQNEYLSENASSIANVARNASVCVAMWRST